MTLCTWCGKEIKKDGTGEQFGPVSEFIARDADNVKHSFHPSCMKEYRKWFHSGEMR